MLDKDQVYKTSLGGVLSLFTWIGALIYFAYGISRVTSNEYTMAAVDGYKGYVLDITHNLTGHFDGAF